VVTVYDRCYTGMPAITVYRDGEPHQVATTAAAVCVCPLGDWHGSKDRDGRFLRLSDVMACRTRWTHVDPTEDPPLWLEPGVKLSLQLVAEMMGVESKESSVRDWEAERLAADRAAGKAAAARLRAMRDPGPATAKRTELAVVEKRTELAVMGVSV
jgi:hypothetical protein